LILGIQPKDYDLEVYGLQANELKLVLSKLGHTELVGRLFGVFKLWIDHLEIDVSLPRHHGFPLEGMMSS